MKTTLTLTGIAHGGEAFGHHDGKIVFVPYSIPGEVVEVEIVEEKPRWARARLVNVLEPSPNRVEPPCPYFGPGECGRCQWQHIAYERQLALKADLVVDQLQRLGFIADPPVLDLIALADDTGLLDYGYRNHMHFAVTEGDELGHLREGKRTLAGQSTVGMGDRERTPGDDIIPIDACLLLHPVLDEVHGALESGALAAGEVDDETGTDPEAPREPPVVVRRVGLHAGIHTGQRLIVFETEDDRLPAFVVEDLPVRCVLRERNGAIQSLIGDPWFEEIIAGRTFRVSASSFFHSNSVGAQVMVELVTEMLAPHGHETLLDANCGVGLFGLSLAGQVAHVVGIEEDEDACEDFAWNARDLNNITLHEGPVAEVLATLDPSQRIDLAVVEPPHSGVGAEVVAQLSRLAIPKLVVVSYDPAALARDAKLFVESGYRLQQVQPIDLFPQTFRVVSLALFSKQ
jgi:23S rRNA (uracil1939-C5)-methyltransferase